MRKKDYELIARVIAQSELPAAAHTSIAKDFAEALERDSGLDLNGNRRFKRDRFLKAAGVMTVLPTLLAQSTSASGRYTMLPTVEVADDIDSLAVLAERDEAAIEIYELM